MKALLDFIPLIAFFIGAAKFDIWIATAALLAATVVVSIIHLILQKGRLTKQQLIILVFTIVFCGLTLVLKNDLFVKSKSSVINVIFAVALIVSILIKKPALQLLMKDVFKLTPSGWNKLTLAWAGFFLFMAALHYYFAFYTSYEMWYKFKSYGGIPITIAFMIGQFVVLKNHLNPKLTADNQDSDPSS